MAKKTCLVFIVLFICYVPYAKSSNLTDKLGGTAIVYVWLNDRFVVATDSLALRDPAQPRDYKDCKIVPQGSGNEFFVVSGGVRRVRATFPTQMGVQVFRWDMQAFAAEAFNATRSVGGAKEPQEVANEYRDLVLAKLNSLPQQVQKDFGGILPNSSLLFVGLRANGQVDAIAAWIRYDGGSFTIVLQRPMMNEIGGLAQGREIAEEFLSGTSLRGRNEFNSWRAKLQVADQASFMTQMAIEAVRFIIKYPPTKNGAAEVGGSVEAVELRPNSTIKWLQPCPTGQSSVQLNH